MDMPDHRLMHPFKGPGVAAEGLTGISTVLLRCLIIFNWG